MFKNLVLTRTEKDELQRMMIGSVRVLPPYYPSHHHTKDLNSPLGILKNSFLSREQFASELYLIFKIVDKGVYVFGGLVGYQEKMEDQYQN